MSNTFLTWLIVGSVAALGLLLFVGLTTMIGQALGAGLPDRARKTLRAGLKTLITIVCAEAFLLWIARRPLVALFIPGQTEVIREGARLIELFAIGMPFLSAFFAADAVYRGAGHTTPMMIVALLRLTRICFVGITPIS